MVSPPVLAGIAKRCGIGAGRLSGLGRITAERAARAHRARQRAAGERDPGVEDTVPARDAGAAADPGHRRVHPGADRRGRDVPRRRRAARARRVHEEPCRRAARAGQDARDLSVARPGARQRHERRRDGHDRDAHLPDRVRRCALAACSAIGRFRRRRSICLAADRSGPPEPEDPTDLWPRTTRLLPWMFAGFIALIWLTPFNAIEINVSLPIELRLDRLVLPVSPWSSGSSHSGPAAESRRGCG